MDAASRTTAVAEAQRRLLLVLRAQHGPGASAHWARVCGEAGVLSTGLLTLDELDRATAVLVARGGVEAVAARSCRVRLVFLGGGRGRQDRAERDVVLDDASVRAAFRTPGALDEASWRRRLAELEAGLEAA